MWIAFNQIEDQTIEEQAYWSHAKYVASTHNPKGVRQTTNKEKHREEMKRMHRQEELDLYYYLCIGVMSAEGDLGDGRAMFRRLKSVDELQSEYRQWVSGEKDLHDQIVENWKNMITRRHEEEMQHREEVHKQRQASPTETDEYELEEPARFVGYSAAQIAEIMRERQGGTPKVRQVYDDRAAKRHHVYKQHLEKKALPPPEGGFFPQESMDSHQQGKPRKPLDEQLRERRFRMDSDPSSTRES
jgi:hypothetical protein